MNALVLLVPIALLLGLLGLGGFLWALRTHQYEDLEGAASRILFDDDPPRQPKEPKP
ncbi:MAG: cbb3-type cytochrome oxidase assembly protein CcoS [Acetobacteraceae bacterium]|nr:cbb3-type cytochrome oxidase assembly protein CcoS [Acetobacteraceae bacterium]